MPFETIEIVRRDSSAPEESDPKRYLVRARYIADFAPTVIFELNDYAPDVAFALEMISDFADSCRAAGTMGMYNRQLKLDIEEE